MRWSGFSLGAGGDAHVVIHRELITVKHFRPREAVRFHAAFASATDALAETTTRVDGVVEADRTEERAEEELSIDVTVDVLKWYPGAGLLRHFGDRVVIQ